MLDSVAAPELRLLNVVPPVVTSSVPATTVLPVLPATVNLFDEIASDPSDAVTANFPLFTSTSPATSSVLDSVAAPVTFNVLNSVVAVTSSVLDSVAAPELRLLNVVAPVTSSVPATTVLPVSPATVNLFDEIASDPSDAVTANFPLFTSTSPATSSVLDSVAAPELRLLNVAPVTSSVQRPRHHRVARVASHRELVRRNRQRPVRCRHRKLPTVHVHVACHIQRARQRRSSRAQAAQRSRSRHVQRPRHHRVARVASHRELVRRNASDPSDADTANFPLFTSTSPATSSVLDSVVSRHVQQQRRRSLLDSVAAPERSQRSRSSRSLSASTLHSRHIQRRKCL